MGKDTISNTFSFIYRLLILYFMLLLLSFVMSVFLFLLSIITDTVYCEHLFTHARNQILIRISKSEYKVQYFSEQVKESDLLYKKALLNNLPENVKQ